MKNWLKNSIQKIVSVISDSKTVGILMVDFVASVKMFYLNIKNTKTKKIAKWDYNERKGLIKLWINEPKDICACIIYIIWYYLVGYKDFRSAEKMHDENGFGWKKTWANDRSHFFLETVNL